MKKDFKIKEVVNSELQSKINISIIFNYLRESSPISRSKISRDLKISSASVSRAVEKLIRKKYVVETGKQKTKMGKKPILLEINREKGCVIGVDLGKERIRVALSDFKGKEKLPVSKATKKEELIEIVKKPKSLEKAFKREKTQTISNKTFLSPFLKLLP